MLAMRLLPRGIGGDRHWLRRRRPSSAKTMACSGRQRRAPTGMPAARPAASAGASLATMVSPMASSLAIEDDFGAEEFHALDPGGKRVLPALSDRRTNSGRMPSVTRHRRSGRIFQRQAQMPPKATMPFSASAGSRLMRGWPMKRATSIWAGSS